MSTIPSVHLTVKVAREKICTPAHYYFDKTSKLKLKVVFSRGYPEAYIVHFICLEVLKFNFELSHIT